VFKSRCSAVPKEGSQELDLRHRRIFGRARLRALVFLLILLAAAVSAIAGSYQRSINGQALVWNNYPRSSDQAAWSGPKDSAGYATGSGTLTWYKGQTLVGRYTGMMVRGKLDGLVTNVDADGRTFRGTFVDGVKTNNWVEIGKGNSPGAGQGIYIKTYDGRAYVWNNYPKSEDQATWTGEIDSDAYATGPGIIRWYKHGQQVTAYQGTMVRGKHDGVVYNEDADGKRYQGRFVDGVKSTDWTAVTEFTARKEPTPEQKALNGRWAQYLKEIQADNDYPNWSGPPYDLYARKQ
jgi:hypothetical protein